MPSPSTGSGSAFFDAIAALRLLIAASGVEVISRLPDGTVELRINSTDGSYIAATSSVPSYIEATPRLRILDLHIWSAPFATRLEPFRASPPNPRDRILVLMFLDACRDAVMEALGPSARHAAWWTDPPPIMPPLRIGFNSPFFA